MARTDIDTVKEVIATALTDAEITAFINQANRVVTTILGSSSLTSAQLTDIETWFAAHLIAISKERQALKEKVGDVELNFQQNPSGFLQLTTYGQMVLMLDSSGLFQSSNMKRAAFKSIAQDIDDD